MKNIEKYIDRYNIYQQIKKQNRDTSRKVDSK